MHLSVPAVDFPPGQTRLTTELTPERDGVPFRLVVEASDALDLDLSAAVFAPTALALASWYHEDLTIEDALPDDVAAALARAAPHLGAINRSTPSKVVADRYPSSPGPAGPVRHGLFFSRGLDSSTALVLSARRELDPVPDVGILIDGFEARTGESTAAEAVAAGEGILAAFGLGSLTVRTNLYDEVTTRGVPWLPIHGAALATIGYLLRHHLSSVLIASLGGSHPDPVSFDGSHPELDPLFSLDGLRVINGFGEMPRAARAALVAEDGRPLDWLHVCLDDPIRNCGRCRKCQSTMLSLHAVDALARTRTFDGPLPSIEDIASMELPELFVDDLAAVLEPVDPSRARAVSRRRGLDAEQPAVSIFPEELHALHRLDTHERSLAWTLIGQPFDAAAGVAAHAAALGPGAICTWNFPIPRATVDRCLRASRLALWASPGPDLERDLVLAALAAGTRPFAIVPDSDLAARRASLPEQMRPLVGGLAELADVASEDPSMTARLAEAVTGGGIAWTVSGGAA